MRMHRCVARAPIPLDAAQSSLQAWCRLCTENASAAVAVRKIAFLGDHCRLGWSLRLSLQQPRLVVKPFDRSELLLAAKPRFLHGQLKNANRLVINAQRHGKWLPILAPVRKRKSRRIGETIRCAM